MDICSAADVIGEEYRSVDPKRYWALNCAPRSKLWSDGGDIERKKRASVVTVRLKRVQRKLGILDMTFVLPASKI
jgi:hypothetical protein